MLQNNALVAPFPNSPFEEFVIGTLQLFVGKFKEIDSRFDGVDSRFDGVDSRFDAVDSRFDAVDRRFDGVDEKFLSIDAEFKSVHHSIADLCESVRFIADRMVTKDELKAEFDVRLKDMVTKQDLAATEYRIKDYVDKRDAQYKHEITASLRKEFAR